MAADLVLCSESKLPDLAWFGAITTNAAGSVTFIQTDINFDYQLVCLDLKAAMLVHC